MNNLTKIIIKWLLNVLGNLNFIFRWVKCYKIDRRDLVSCVLTCMVSLCSLSFLAILWSSSWKVRQIFSCGVTRLPFRISTRRFGNPTASIPLLGVTSDWSFLWFRAQLCSSLLTELKFGRQIQCGSLNIGMKYTITVCTLYAHELKACRVL